MNSWSDKEEEEFRASVDEEIKAAVIEAEKKGAPPVSTLFTDVYAGSSAGAH